MRPGPPALCPGSVWHRRLGAKAHSFSYDVVFVWFDPDRPESVTDLHWAWSTGRFRPAQIRQSDYGWPETGSSAEQIRRLLRDVDPNLDAGEVRLLTQPRRWGWLFNPISLYLIWADSPVVPEVADRPIGAVLEVTNTPWKERHHYAVALKPEPSAEASGETAFGATFDKDLHVSPFLPLDMTYQLRILEEPPGLNGRRWPTLAATISVVDRTGDLVLETGMNLERRTATPRALADTLRRDGFPTHRTSAGIHHQAARLMAKGVAFVPHPIRSTRRGSTQH